MSHGRDLNSVTQNRGFRTPVADFSYQSHRVPKIIEIGQQL